MFNMAAILTQSVSLATKKIYSVSFPVQGLVGASSTHTLCNVSGREILLKDGHEKAAQLFNTFAAQLDEGVIWTDKGLKSTAHYFDPNIKRGMWLWPNAAQKCTEYFNRALKLWHSCKHDKAIFWLGAATHLVQDMCVPHHACCQVFRGHQEYEKWVEKHKYRYSVQGDGIYFLGNTPEEWILENARFAKNYLSCVDSEGTEDDYDFATGVLLPRAQRTTSGFLYYFYKNL